MSITRLYLILTVLLISCRGQTVEKQDFEAMPVYNEIKADKNEMRAGSEIENEVDSNSVRYLLSQAAEKNLNSYWTQKLMTIGDYRYVGDPALNIKVNDHWSISDSVFAIVVNYSAGAGSEELLITIKEKNKFISILRISDLPVRDFKKKKYAYIQYKKLDNRSIELNKVELSGPEEKEIMQKNSEEWSIRSNGIIKRTN